MRIIKFLKIIFQEIPRIWLISEDMNWGVIWYSSSDVEDWAFKSNVARDFLLFMKKNKQKVITKQNLYKRWVKKE